MNERRERRVARWCSGLWLLVGSMFGHGAEMTQTEIKAVYTARIAEYTSWPLIDDVDLPTVAGRFVIGVVGTDPNDVLELIRERINSGKGFAIKGHPVEVIDAPLIGSFEGDRYVSSALEDYSLLFFSEDSQTEWARWQALLARRPIMTVGELQGFALQGGMVEYQYDQAAQRMYMVFNMQALQEAGLVVSAKLLGLNVSRPINQGVSR